MNIRIVLFISVFIGPLAVSNTQAATYYIAANGSDSNNGTSKSTPWAHLPGMVNCTVTCASTTPRAGDSFVFRGGDTWGAASMGIGWGWSGTSSSPIYIGVDQTWYTGSSWVRPVWTCGGGACSGGGLASTNFFYSGAGYFILDNIEMTGLHTSGGNGGQYVYIYGPHQEFKNLYIHGWSHAASGDSDNGSVFGGHGGYDITGSYVHDSVVDGSDTTRDMMVAFFGTIPCAYNNVVQYVTNGFEAGGDLWYNNLVQYVMPCFTGNCHQNFMFHFHPYAGNTAYIFNNVIAHGVTSVGGGTPKLWLEGLGACPNCTTYAFNNVIYDQQQGNFLNITDHPADNYGTFYIYNNTFQVGNDGDLGGWTSVSPEGQTYTIYFANNHWIASGVTCTAASGCSQTNDIVQTMAQANAQGYNDTTETFGFSPAGANNATVGAGTNLSGLCSGNVAALCNDTTYGVGYNTATHTVIAPGRTTHIRPASGPWDSGAYQYTALAILYGDVSENGSITSYDASLVAQYAVGSITLTSTQITKADVSGNGSVTSYDASLIAQYAVGLITKFPVQGQ